jgi:hypothetical protein
VSNLTVIEAILRDRRSFFREIREGIGLRDKMRAMLVSSIVFLAIYGAVLGSTHSLWQAFSSGVKFPLLFVATLVVCAYPLLLQPHLRLKPPRRTRGHPGGDCHRS